MKKIIFCMITLILLLTSKTILASDQDTEISTILNRILVTTNTDLNIGIMVANPATGKILYTRNPDRLFTPASNMKLVTAYAALLTLGTNFVFQTAIYADRSQIKEGILHGNVYLQFGGDPGLTLQDLNSLIQSLANAGIKKITGQFVIVNNDFAHVGYGEGWMWDDANHCFGQAPNSMVVNHNCFSVIVYPAAKVGAFATIKIGDNPVRFAVSNQIHTANYQDKCHLKIESDEANNYFLQGCVNKSAGKNNYPRELKLAVRNVNQYVVALVNGLLKTNNIQLAGRIQFGKLRSRAKPLLVINSDPLPQLLADMLKPSDNLYANALFLKIGQVYFGGTGNWKKSQKAVQAILQTKLGIDHKSWEIIDGSGESRYNMMTPRQMLNLLHAVYQNQVLYQTLMQAMPTSGIDGTLEYRMTRNSIKGRVMAKTGTMKGVSSLSGFIKAHDQTLAFAIFMNNFVGSEQHYQFVQDKICEYLTHL